MNERDIEALRRMSPHIDWAVRELEMQDHFRARLGVSDVVKPSLWADLMGDEGPDCD